MNGLTRSSFIRGAMAMSAPSEPRARNGVIYDQKMKILKQYEQMATDTSVPLQVKLFTTRILDLYECADANPLPLYDMKQSIDDIWDVMDRWSKDDPREYLMYADTLKHIYDEAYALVDMRLLSPTDF